MKTIVAITGATGAIGLGISELIAENHDYEVVLLCRNEKKGDDAIRYIQKNSGNQSVKYEIVDLSSWKSIKSLANRWDRPLHVLINNAAIAPRKREVTPEGIELQFATNVLGYFWMMKAFQQILINSSPARIVNVASYWAGDLVMDDLEFKNRMYDNNQAYRQSKQANRMLTVAFAKRLKEYQVSVNSCHPGDVNSSLSKNLGFGGHQSPKQGARTPVWLAVQPVGQENTGKYFEEKRITGCSFGKDIHAVEKLYEICEAYCY